MYTYQHISARSVFTHTRTKSNHSYSINFRANQTTSNQTKPKNMYYISINNQCSLFADKGQLADNRRSRSREPTPVRRRSMSRDTTPVVQPLPERKPIAGNEPWFVQKPPSTMNCHESEVLTLKAIVDGDPKPKGRRFTKSLIFLQAIMTFSTNNYI